MQKHNQKKVVSPRGNSSNKNSLKALHLPRSSSSFAPNHLQHLDDEAEATILLSMTAKQVRKQ